MHDARGVHAQEGKLVEFTHVERLPNQRDTTAKVWRQACHRVTREEVTMAP